MIKNNQYIVIGSGPSGVSCATALLKKKNIKVLMLDTGYDLEKYLELEPIKGELPSWVIEDYKNQIEKKNSK